jgi:hypothetical protein
VNFSQLEQLWISQGGDPATAPIMAAIALAESTGNPSSFNAADPYGGSCGLWQINGSHTTGYGGPFNVNNLFGSAYNTQAAIQISGNGRSLTPWSTFNSWVAGDGGRGDTIISQYLGKYAGQIPGSAIAGASSGGSSSSSSSSSIAAGPSWLQNLGKIPVIGPGIEGAASTAVVSGFAIVLLLIGGIWLILGNEGSRTIVVNAGKTAKAAAIDALA